MVVSVNIILLLSSVIGAFAAPTVKARGHTFSVPAIHNDKYVRNGTAALLKAYAKYGLKPTSKDNILSSVLEKRQDGSVSASPDPQDVEYLCPVSIGGQTLNLDFDTGSADFWLFSDLLPQSDQSGHTIYSSSKSSTFQSLQGYTWQISYGDGSGASGVVGTDTVTIGGTTVQSQAVELANTVSSTFVTGAGDGLVGLSFSNINTVQPQAQSTFIENAAPSLDSPLFAAYLPFQTSGAFDFGAPDSSRYSGTIKTTSVDSSGGFWQFDSTSYKVGKKTYSASGTVGIADTGTTLILMGDAQVSKYYAAVKGANLDNTQGGYVFPCSATLPTLSFSIGTAGYATIPAKYLNFGAVDQAGTSCFGSLQSIGTGNMNIYGDIFFNAYYGVFDIGTPSFGFAAST